MEPPTVDLHEVRGVARPCHVTQLGVLLSVGRARQAVGEGHESYLREVCIGGKKEGYRISVGGVSLDKKAGRSDNSVSAKPIEESSDIGIRVWFLSKVLVEANSSCSGHDTK
jgi:hypothetical protein